MAFNSITSRQIDGKIMETVTDLVFLGSKITVEVNCSHEIKRHLFLRRKAMILLIVVYRCESWTIKNAEHKKIDAFKLGH